MDGSVALPMMSGVLYGAVTNTPGLGAAQEALNQLGYTGDPIALGYACAYPLGVIGIIGAMLIIKQLFKIHTKEEEKALAGQEDTSKQPHTLYLEVRNEAIDGKQLLEVKSLSGRNFVVSRIKHNGYIDSPNQDTIFNIGDQLRIVCAEDDAAGITAFIGREVEGVKWEDKHFPLVSRRILVTKSEINGKKLGDLHFRSMHGVNVTRVNRSGMDLFAAPNLKLQVGDRVMVVKPSIAKPERGDIITFKDPGGWLPSKEKKHSDILIKRLIGMPGDKVECEGGGAPIVVNGEPLDESAYLQEGMAPSEIPFSVTVPEGHVFVLGDNRTNSADSRYHFHDIGTDGTGTVPMENITGVSKLIYWPFSHWSVTR